MNTQRTDRLAALVTQLANVLNAFRDATRPEASRHDVIETLDTARSILCMSAYEVLNITREIDALPPGKPF